MVILRHPLLATTTVLEIQLDQEASGAALLTFDPALETRITYKDPEPLMVWMVFLSPVLFHEATLDDYDGEPSDYALKDLLIGALEL